MEPYPYEPLGKGEIRLLKLHPKTSIGPLSGSLLHVPLIKPTYCERPADSAYLEHLYPYDAISYSWGADTSTPLGLAIDQYYTIGVTAHLHYILERVAQPDKSVLFWIDAICINQADRDSEEKIQQIRLMPDVYRFAKRVQIHLGPEADDSPLAIEFIAHVADYAEYLDESLKPREVWKRMRSRWRSGSALPPKVTGHGMLCAHSGCGLGKTRKAITLPIH
ncbi:hypothetical protein E8E11_008736 [Didymella keratinophila]|nr:hypothetical protein E8E11_008736 [Didymella keratinophila]